MLCEATTIEDDTRIDTQVKQEVDLELAGQAEAAWEVDSTMMIEG